MGSTHTSASRSKPETGQRLASTFSTALILLGILALVAGTVYLLETAPATGEWAQAYDPTGIWWVSTIVAALPVFVLLGSMAILHLKAHVAAVIGLVTALAIAITVYHMPVRLALTTTAFGAGYGLFPICWIILPVIYLYQLTVKTGRFTALQESLTNITDDGRLQLLLIAFALGAFFEGAAGFGTPVAVCGAILISLGFKPIQAAGLSLIANTAPVAFGGLGIPIITLNLVTGVDVLSLSKTIAIILIPFCLLVPFWLIWAYAGFKAMLEIWPAILVAAVTFATAQFLMATYAGPWLVAIVSATSTIVVLVVFLRLWKPKRILNVSGEDITGQVRRRFEHSTGATVKAWLPWVVLSVVVFVWGLPQVSKLLNQVTINFSVAGLDKFVWRVPPVVLKASSEAAVYKLNWLAATGTGIFVAAILAGLLMGLGPKQLAVAFGKTVLSVRFTVLTIAAMLALGYVTRYCGLDATLGLAFARTGVLYPFFGTLIGWLGTATTGSDTSSNVLFGSLQKLTAQQINVSPVLMCSANSAGGVMGKMIDAQSIVVASTATQNYGQEGTILRFVFWHSLALAALIGVFVFLLAYVAPFTGLVVR
ncbi:MAG: L-lactate permease [Terracidiphilus sp.]|jgi:lactate permease